MDEGYGLDIICLHYRKALHVVPKQRLKHKFCQYVTPNTYANWISSFLTSRNMQEPVNSVLSHLMDILSGVLQESKLGPFLLILCVNELRHYHTGFAIAYDVY